MVFIPGGCFLLQTCRGFLFVGCVMIKIDLYGDKEIIRRLNNLRERDLRFSVAYGLTMIAKDAQAVEIRILPEKFTLRTGWWKPNTPYGIKITPANKQTLESAVFTRAQWLPLHETGGVKQASGKRLAVPLVGSSSIRGDIQYGVKRTKRDLVMKSQKPRALSNAFIIKGKRGDLLAQRTGKGKRSVLRIMYALEPKANISKRLMFEDVARRVVQDVWQKRMNDAIDSALRTSGLK